MSTRVSVDDIVKGVFVRCQESHGIVMLAFYDIRDAKFAKCVLSTRASGALADCVDNKLSGDDTHLWLGCRFVTAEELMKVGHIYIAIYRRLSYITRLLEILPFWRPPMAVSM
jgi:hypothetical protein